MKNTPETESPRRNLHNTLPCTVVESNPRNQESMGKKEPGQINLAPFPHLNILFEFSENLLIYFLSVKIAKIKLRFLNQLLLNFVYKVGRKKVENSSKNTSKMKKKKKRMKNVYVKIT